LRAAGVPVTQRTIFGFGCERTIGAWIHACDTTMQYGFVLHSCDVIALCTASQISNNIQNNLHFDEQITAILKSSQCSYLLKMLRDQGLSKKNMDSVFHALILFKIRYALCARGGHITEANKGQINAFLRRMHRYGYVSAVYNIDDMICAADAKLFLSMCKVHHCINYLLPEAKTSDYSLRKRDHSLNGSSDSVNGDLQFLWK